MNNKIKWLSLAILVFASASSLAGVYKWVDESGNMHYTQTPPPAKSKVKVEEIDVHKISSPIKKKEEVKESSEAELEMPTAISGKPSPERIAAHCVKAIAKFKAKASASEKERETAECEANLKDADNDKMKEVESFLESI